MYRDVTANVRSDSTADVLKGANTFPLDDVNETSRRYFPPVIFICIIIMVPLKRPDPERDRWIGLRFVFLSLKVLV